jgi:hypothetical protein
MIHLLVGPHVEERLDIALFLLLSLPLVFPYGVASLFRFQEASNFLSCTILHQQIFVFLFTVFQVAALLAIFGI